MITVKQMYNKCKADNTALLSTFNANFWAPYIANYSHYDSLFRRLYDSFAYFLQEWGDSVEEVTNDFTADVYNHLLVNEKKYAELFRINVLADENYSLTNNYDMTEVMSRQTGETIGSRTDNEQTTLGSRTDTTSATQGQQDSSTENQVTPYDAEEYYDNGRNISRSGERTDTSSSIIGGQTNNTQNIQGSQSNSGSENYTLTRKGNIGVMTATDMLEKHKGFWTLWDFYGMIFGDICRELLVIGR